MRPTENQNFQVVLQLEENESNHLPWSIDRPNLSIMWVQWAVVEWCDKFVNWRRNIQHESQVIQNE